MANRLKRLLWFVSAPILIGVGIAIGYSQISDDNCNTLESKLLNIGTSMRGLSDIGLNVTKVCNIAGYKIYVNRSLRNREDLADTDSDIFLSVDNGSHLFSIDKYSISTLRKEQKYDHIGLNDRNKDGRIDDVEYNFIDRKGRTGVVIDHGRTGQLDFRLYDGEREDAEIWVDGKWRNVIRKEGIDNPFVKINGRLIRLEPIMKNGTSLGFRQKR